MNLKIIKKLLAYAHQNEIFDLAITQKDDHHILSADTGAAKHQIKLPAKLETELGGSFRQLLSLSPADLVSNTYFKTKELAFRLSIIPEAKGEKIIINTVHKSKKLLILSHLGLGRNERHEIENFLRRRRGLVLIGASNNQGKTTTLYSLLEKINKINRSCYLLSEHLELELDGVNKLTSHSGQRLNNLTTVLKNDSEVIAIDDITKDLLPEAVMAAETGRLILASIKVDSASEMVEQIRAINKNKDLEILVIFQKLLNKNCPHCLKAYIIGESEELITKYWPRTKKYKPKHFFTSQGCKKCQHSGTSGQIAAFNLIKLNKQEINIFSSLASDVLEKAANGLISISKFISEHKSTSIKKL